MLGAATRALPKSKEARSEAPGARSLHGRPVRRRGWRLSKLSPEATPTAQRPSLSQARGHPDGPPRGPRTHSTRAPSSAYTLPHRHARPTPRSQDMPDSRRIPPPRDLPRASGESAPRGRARLGSKQSPLQEEQPQGTLGHRGGSGLVQRHLSVMRGRRRGSTRAIFGGHAG